MMTWNGIFFQGPSSYLSELITCMHDYVMMFLLSTMFMVLLSLAKVFASMKFNISFLEDHQLESLWTVAPFLILSFILVPSLTSLYMLDSCNFCGFSVKIMGHQWYWSYEMKELSEFSFDSYMLQSGDSKIRLLDVDNRLLLSSHIPTRFLISSADVIHSWTIPSLGFKMDAVPGRINQFCLTPKRTGVFFGQCSEICGANHSFMPIVVESVPLSDILNKF